MNAVTSSRTAPEGPPPVPFVLHPGRVAGELSGSPSKSYTHRALLRALLSQGGGELLHPLRSEDTLASARVAEVLGLSLDGPEDPASDRWRFRPGNPPGPATSRLLLDARESGTTLRLFSAASALSGASVQWQGAGSLAVRPMDPLLDALELLGVHVERAAPGRSLPFHLRGPLRAGSVELPGGTSSQFLSALLFSLPVLAGESRIDVLGPQVSEPYVEATLHALASAGVQVAKEGTTYHVPGGQRYRAGTLPIPADASSAAYLFALAALTGGKVRVGPFPEGWPQADLELLNILRAAGAGVRREGEDYEVTAGGLPLGGFEADLDRSPDLAPLLGVLASFAGEPCELRGGTQLVHKESDRRAGTEALVASLGARLERVPTGWRIQGPPKARRLSLTDLTDHRMLLSACVAASALPEPSRLGPASAAAKSYPAFFEHARTLGLTIERTEGRGVPP